MCKTKAVLCNIQTLLVIDGLVFYAFSTLFKLYHRDDGRVITKDSVQRKRRTVMI